MIILEQNIRDYNLSNVSLHLGTCLEYFPLGEVLYLDPPWGEDYRRHYLLHLYLDDINIMDIIARTDYFLTVVKVPRNYAYRQLRGFLTHKGCLVWRNPIRNYYLIFIKKPWIYFDSL